MRTLIGFDHWAVRALALLALAGAGTQEPTTQGPLPSDFDAREVTAHFVVLWRADETGTEEAAAVTARAEELYAAIQTFVDGRFAPEERLVLMLSGDGVRADGTSSVPHVDGTGRIHVFRYPGNGYLGELAHELVHALRFGSLKHFDGFFEEGFAELVNLNVAPEQVGFPRYGFPLTVVAGHWVARDEDVPLLDLQRKHTQLNMPCRVKAYPLRASFFVYLTDTYGLDKMLALAAPETPATLKRYEDVLGTPFEQLAAEWRAALATDFAAWPEAKARAESWLAQTPIRFFPICE
jgi:hypothetical protein